MHDRPFLADEAIEQRRLADVRPAHDGDPGRALPRGSRASLLAILIGPLGQSLHDGVEEIAGPPALEGADRYRRPQTEPAERPNVRLTHVVVDLVHNHQHARCVTRTQERRDAVVVVGGSHGDVDDEHDQIGSRDGALRLLAHLRVERLVTVEPAPGVDDGEPPATPFGLDGLAVTRDPGMLLDDRLAPPEHAVDEGGLAHVGPSDHGHDGKFHDAQRAMARRRATPSVATISTGRGRSAGRVPSRKTPFDRHTSGRRYRAPTGSHASARATSEPTRSPVTAMLPPKNSLRTGTTRTSSRPSRARRGARTRAP